MPGGYAAGQVAVLTVLDGLQRGQRVPLRAVPAGWAGLVAGVLAVPASPPGRHALHPSRR